MRKIGAVIGAITAIGLSGPAHSVPTVTNVTGALSKAENTCVSPIEFFSFSEFQLCSYSGGVTLQQLAGSGMFRNWMGPVDSGGYYASGTLVDPGTTGGFSGSTPGDGKVNLVITGSITVEDGNTAGDGSDDSISGTLIFGPGERGASSSDGNVVERFTSVTHTLPTTVVSSAVSNSMGGYDYVIGSQGYPLLFSSGEVITSAVGPYPSEVASIATNNPSPPDFNAWDVNNGGNVTVLPFGSTVPHSPEIVSYAPGSANGGNVEPNIGMATTAVVVGLTCEDGDADADPGTNGDGNPIADCNPDPAIGAGSSWSVSGAEFDNLILRLSTDANNKLVSADAFYTLEYKIASLNLNAGKPGSFVGGTLSVSGDPEAADDAQTTPQNVDVDISILANDFGFSDPVAVTLPGGGASTNGGTVLINGVNPGAQAGISVNYDPPVGFSGPDTFDYTVADGVNSDTATVSITVTGGGGGGDIFPVAPNAGISSGEGASVDINIGALPGVSLGNMPVTVTVVSGPASGTATVFGQIVTYTPTGFPSADAFDYTIEDVDGDTSTGTISIAIGPPLVPTAVNDADTVKQDGFVNIPVKANDSAGSGSIDVHTVTITTDPVSGTAVVEPDNTVTYTPDPGVSGIHTFQYTLTDANQDESAAATVTVTVEKTGVAVSLPPGGSSAIGPWGLGFLVIIVWLRRHRSM